ncbi:hypothetical protein ACFQMM_02385 [Saliphagus sp. GCM10025308]
MKRSDATSDSTDELDSVSTFLWLNQKSEENSGYSDAHGQVYHFRGGIPGYKIIGENCRFVYYQPEIQSFTGTGQISQIETRIPDAFEDQPKNDIPPSMINYYAHIDDYCPSDPPIPARVVKEQIPMLADREGLRGVPQHGITEIDRENFEAILNLAEREAALE